MEKISFEDTQAAFSDKSNKQLRVMHFLYLTMSRPALTRIGTWLTHAALNLRLPVKGIIKKTLFAQFCGGESLAGCQNTIDQLGQANIKSILDYAAEGEKSEAGFEANKQETLRSIAFADSTNHVPIAVMKLTAFVSFDLLVKVQEKQQLTEGEQKQYNRFLARVDEVCAKAVQLNKCLFVDAEESWIQSAIDDAVYEMMLKYNKEKVYIFNTYQTYTTKALTSLKNAHKALTKAGSLLGAKLVRGAYMEKERERAAAMGYEDPIQPDKEACDRDYDLAITYCVEHLNEIALCAGTHNENSATLLYQLMIKKGVNKSDQRVYFAQLYGMSDNISYQLSKSGFNVAKYVPYGPVAKVLPYLMRRAEENTSIAGQTGREFLLVKKELKRRRALSH